MPAVRRREDATGSPGKSPNDSAQMLVQERLHYRVAFLVGELWSTVRRPMDYLELNLHVPFFVGVVELVRLVDGHLRILVSMQHQQRRIGRIDVEHGAGETRQTLFVLRLTSEEKVQGGYAHTETMWG